LRKALAKRSDLEDSAAAAAASEKQQGSKEQHKGAADESTIVRTPEDIAARSEKRKQRKKAEREAKTKTRSDDKTVFVSAIHGDESAVRAHFTVCGEIDSVKVLLDKAGKPRGLAYISYKTTDGADAALKFHETKYQNKILSVQESQPKLKDNSDFEVFVKHFPRESTDDALRKVFASCGTIDKLKIPRFEDGAAKGMAFFVFTDYRSVKKALALDGKQMGEKRIEVKKSDKKDAQKPEKVDTPSDGQTGLQASKGGGKNNGKAEKGKGKGKGGKDKGKAEKGKSNGKAEGKGEDATQSKFEARQRQKASRLLAASL